MSFVCSLKKTKIFAAAMRKKYGKMICARQVGEFRLTCGGYLLLSLKKGLPTSRKNCGCWFLLIRYSVDFFNETGHHQCLAESYSNCS
jgi:hypothetical protein